MDTEFFSDIEPGQVFITYYHSTDNAFLGWFAKIISPTQEYNAVSLDDGERYYLEDIHPVVVEYEA